MLRNYFNKNVLSPLAISYGGRSILTPTCSKFKLSALFFNQYISNFHDVLLGVALSFSVLRGQLPTRLRYIFFSGADRALLPTSKPDQHGRQIILSHLILP